MSASNHQELEQKESVFDQGFSKRGQCQYLHYSCDIELTAENLSWSAANQKNPKKRITWRLPLQEVIAARVEDSVLTVISIPATAKLKLGGGGCTGQQRRKYTQEAEFTFSLSNQEVNQWLQCIRLLIYSTPTDNIEHLAARENTAYENLAGGSHGAVPQYAEPATRRLLFLVNPIGGTKKAKRVCAECLSILDKVPHIKTTVIETEYAGHARDYCLNTLQLGDYHGIITVSGDGLLWEVLNGLMQRHDWREAITIPLGIIPSGSGNGLATSLGLLDPLDALRAIARGIYRPLDVFSVFQRDKRYFCFLSLSWALIADCDVGTDDLRWMGTFRFTFGAIRSILKKPLYRAKLTLIQAPVNAAYPEVNHPIRWNSDVDLLNQRRGSFNPRFESVFSLAYETQHQHSENESIGKGKGKGKGKAKSIASGSSHVEDCNGDSNKPAAALKHEVKAQYGSFNSASLAATAEHGPQCQYVQFINGNIAELKPESMIPELSANYISREEARRQTVISFEDDIFLFIVCNTSHISSDMNVAPFAHPHDGSMDVLLMRNPPRSMTLSMLLKVESGLHIDESNFMAAIDAARQQPHGDQLADGVPNVECYKVRALKLEPLTTGSHLSLDGERIDYEPVIIEIHPGLANVFCK